MGTGWGREFQSVAQGVLGAELVNNTEAPLAATANEVFGDWGIKLLIVGGAISIFGTLSGDILATPRVIFASARDGSLPKILAKVHPKYKTPYVSIAFYALMISLMALSGTFEPLAVMASGSILIIYGGVSLATLRLRYRDGEPLGNQFKMPGKAIIPVLSFTVITWMLIQLKLEEALGLLALVGASIIIYLIMNMNKLRSSDE